MRRWAINIFCLISLLIFSTSVALWARSYFVGEAIAYRWPASPQVGPPDSRRAEILAYSWAWGTGRISFSTYPAQESGYGHNGLNYDQWSYMTRPDDPSPGTMFLTFFKGHWDYESWGPSGTDDGSTMARMTFPLWLFLPFAIPPLLWLRRWRKTRGRGFLVETKKELDHPPLSTAARDTEAAEKGKETALS